MKLQAGAVAVSGAHAPLLLATSVTARTGEVTLVAGDPDTGRWRWHWPWGAGSH
jgi:hypothetical protein